jgi:hypothetical protein
VDAAEFYDAAAKLGADDGSTVWYGHAAIPESALTAVTTHTLALWEGLGRSICNVRAAGRPWTEGAGKSQLVADGNPGNWTDVPADYESAPAFDYSLWTAVK